jgi:hypothetical protein
MDDGQGARGERVSTNALFFHVRRTMRADLTGGVATDAERAALAARDRGRPAVAGAQAQDYLAWRRSLLWTATGFLAVSAVVAAVSFVVDLFEDTTELEKIFNYGVVRFLEFVQVVAALWLPIAGWRAIRSWDDLRTSHGWTRRGWLIGFLVPFVIALVPVNALFLFEAPTTLEEAQGQTAVVQMVGIAVGLAMFLHLVPSVLAIFVGAIRAALSVKQILPESAVPGWIATVAAPVFAVVALAVFVLFHQMGGNWLLLAGFGLIVANYLLLTRDGSRLARPHRPDDVRALLGPMRRRGALLVGLGALLLLVALFTMDLLGTSFVGFENALLNPFQLLGLAVAVVGRSLFTMVLFSDLLIALLRHAWRETQALQVSELGNVLEARLRALEEGGVTALGRAPAATAPSA